MKGYIYKIENLISGKVYIGQTVNFNRRIYQHKFKNKSNNTSIYNAIRKYGSDNFSYIILEDIDFYNNELNEREEYWIFYYNSYEKGYNETLGGKTTRGYKFSEESKQKIRDNHADVSGKNNPMYGKSRTDEWRQQQSVRLKGKFVGRLHSDKAKQLIKDKNSKVWKLYCDCCIETTNELSKWCELNNYTYSKINLVYYGSRKRTGKNGKFGWINKVETLD